MYLRTPVDHPVAEVMALDIVGSPTCGAPAEAESWSIGSTAGLVPHVKVLCVRPHWHLMPSEVLTHPSTESSGDEARAAPAALPRHRVEPT